MLYKRWTFRTMVAAGLLALGTLALNYTINPFDLYAVPAIPGITSNKNIATHYSRTIKPYKVEQFHPSKVAFGTSRAEIGIDPEHPGWLKDGGGAYNFGLNSASINEVAERFETLLDSQSFKQVVLGLDFLMFNAYTIQPKEKEQLPNIYLRTLFSPNALKASIDTLRKQNPLKHPALLGNGQIAWSVFSGRVSKKGHRSISIKAEKKMLKNFYLPEPYRRFVFSRKDAGIDTLESFKAILQMARANGVDLKLYISPCHARMLELIRQTGLWPKFEEWKRKLVLLLDGEAGRYEEQSPFELWDFSGFNSITIEKFPPLGDRDKTLTYYWESSHFKKETGDLLLDRIFDYQDPARVVPGDFGVKISPDNIEKHLDSIRRSQRDYMRTHKGDVEDIGRIVAESN